MGRSSIILLALLGAILLCISSIVVVSAVTEDSWVVKAPMNEARASGFAVVVNGKIYTIGGATQVYDPVAGTWTTKGQMPSRVLAFGVCVVQNHIYAIGGNEDYAVNAVYDIEAGEWLSKQPMPTPRRIIALTPLPLINGKIYLIGGEKNFTTILDVNEVYDIESDTWTTMSPLPTPRIRSCNYVVDGKIYVIGGRADQMSYRNINSFFNVNEVYDPATDTWETKTPMPAPDTADVNALIDDRIFIFGLNSTYVYDTKNDTWTQAAAIPEYQFNGRTAVPTGAYAPRKIYVIGGYTNPAISTEIFSNETDLTQIFDPQTGNWTRGSSMPTGRTGLCVAVVDDVFYAMGGGDIIWGFALAGEDYNVTEQYTPLGYGTPDPSYVTPSAPPTASPSPISTPTNTPTQTPPTPTPSATLSPSPSIPEFPTWIIAPLIIASAAFVIFCKKAAAKKTQSEKLYSAETLAVP